MPRSLPGLVHHIWEQQSSVAQRWRIMPSGRVELIFRLGPRFSLENALVLRTNPDPVRGFCFLSGLHTRPLDLSFREFHVFGVQMHPVAVRAFFGIPCSEVRDNAVPGELIVPGLARVEDALRSAPDFPSRALWMERELGRRLRAGDRLASAERMRALAQELPFTSLDPMAELHDRLGYSRSHAHRLLREWLGQSATDSIRLARFVRAVHALHRSDDGSLTSIGYRLGYFDQAHFIREFRAYAGMTPGAYRRRRGHEPGQLGL